MKLVVALLAAAVFASLICPASFVRVEIWDGKCPTKRMCVTRDPGLFKNIPEEYKNCTCVQWGCVIDEVYYEGVGCESEDMICKDGVKNTIKSDELKKLRDGDCDPNGPPPTTTTSTTSLAPKPTTEDAITTTTSGTFETKYSVWKFAGMTLIGCFVFFFGGQLW